MPMTVILVVISRNGALQITLFIFYLGVWVPEEPRIHVCLSAGVKCLDTLDVHKYLLICTQTTLNFERIFKFPCSTSRQISTELDAIPHHPRLGSCISSVSEGMSSALSSLSSFSCMNYNERL